MASSKLRRIVSYVAIAGFVAASVVLLLADRSVGLLGSFRAVGLGAGQAVETALNIDLIDRGDIPGSVEQIGHAALWGTGMVLFGWIFRARVPVLLTALFVAGASVIFEVAQPVLSTTRRFEASDALANFTGIAGAVVFLALVIPLERQVRLAGVAQSTVHHRH